MQRPLQRVHDRRHLARLVVEQIDGVARVVPQQMIGPAARLAFEIDVLAAEEIRLHDELLELQLALLDSVVRPIGATD